MLASTQSADPAPHRQLRAHNAAKGLPAPPSPSASPRARAVRQDSPARQVAQKRPEPAPKLVLPVLCRRHRYVPALNKASGREEAPARTLGLDLHVVQALPPIIVTPTFRTLASQFFYGRA